MNTAHLHLMFTHLPIVGLFIALIINVYAILSKSNETKKLTMLIYIFVGLFGLLAYITGDGSGEIIKTYHGISEDLIETHENTAIFFFIGLMVIAAISLLGLYLSRKKEFLLKKINFYLLLAALSISILAFMTGSTGGKIRHIEIEQGVYKK